MPWGHSKTTWGGKKVNNFRTPKIIYFFCFSCFIWSNLGRIWASPAFKPFQTFPNISKHFQIFSNIFFWKPRGGAREGFGDPRNVWKVWKVWMRIQTFSNIFKHFQTFSNISKHVNVLGNVWKCLKRFESAFKPFKPFKHFGFPKISRATPPPGALPKNVWKCLEMFEKVWKGWPFSNISKHFQTFFWKPRGGAREGFGEPRNVWKVWKVWMRIQTFSNIFKHSQTRQRVWKCLKMFGNVGKCLKRFESAFKPFKPFKYFGVPQNPPGHPAAGGPPKMFENVWKCLKRFDSAQILNQFCPNSAQILPEFLPKFLPNSAKFCPNSAQIWPNKTRKTKK